MKPLTRQSRHPMQICQCAAIGAISAWQLILGPQYHHTLWMTPTASYTPLALFTLFGCLALLAATVIYDAWTAAGFEIFGFMCLLGTFSVYLYSVWTTAPFAGTDILTGMLAGFLAGSCIRIFSVARSCFQIVKARRAPPIHDLEISNSAFDAMLEA